MSADRRRFLPAGEAQGAPINPVGPGALPAVPDRGSDSASLLRLIEELGSAGALTPTSLTLRHDSHPDFDRLEALARLLCELHDASKWWIADLLLYVEDTLGENVMYQVAEGTGRSPETLRRWLWVARAVPPVLRRTSLSFHHHQLVAKLPQDEQTAWLDRAEANRWTSRELADAMKPEQPDRSDGLDRLQDAVRSLLLEVESDGRLRVSPDALEVFARCRTRAGWFC